MIKTDKFNEMFEAYQQKVAHIQENRGEYPEISDDFLSLSCFLVKALENEEALTTDGNTVASCLFDIVGYMDVKLKHSLVDMSEDLVKELYKHNNHYHYFWKKSFPIPSEPSECVFKIQEGE